MPDWGQIPFMDYVNEVDDLLLRDYGIEYINISMDQIAAAQEGGDTPQDCVGWIAENTMILRNYCRKFWP